MSRLEELRYIYHTRKKQMDTKMLYEYIDLLQSSNDSMLETMEEISDNQDREIEKHNYRDDMD